MTIKPHQQQHILLFYIIITVRSMKVLIGNTYLLSPAHTYLDNYFQKRRLSQSDSKPRHLKKKIVLTEDLVKLFITNCKSLIFRILE